MALITAPSPPPWPFYTSKNMQGANGITREIFGYPIPNDHSMADGLTAPLSFPNQTTLFDVSSLTENHEVIVVGYVSPNNISSSTTYTLTWFRSRDNTAVIRGQVVVPSPPQGQSYGPGISIYGWIGWLSEDMSMRLGNKEIQENGYYFMHMEASGGESFNQRIDFAVKGIPPQLVISFMVTNQFNYTIRLSEFFDPENYIQAGICSQPFNDGQSYPPDGIVTSVTSNVGNPSTVIEGTIYSNYQSFGPVLYGFAQASNGLYYQSGTVYVGATRPLNWNWYTPKNPNEDFALTAGEWNAFTDKINSFRFYKGLGSYSFTTAPYGSGDFYAWMYDQAVAAISPMTWIESETATSKNQGDPVKAFYLNNLRDSLNSIP